MFALDIKLMNSVNTNQQPLNIRILATSNDYGIRFYNITPEFFYRFHNINVSTNYIDLPIVKLSLNEFIKGYKS